MERKLARKLLVALSIVFPLKDAYAANQPCPASIGSGHPDQGSVMCTGNWQTVVSLPTLKLSPHGEPLSLIHNSHADSGQNVGFGAGWNLSADAYILEISSAKIEIRHGDGSVVSF